jgi:hypothetical protein
MACPQAPVRRLTCYTTNKVDSEFTSHEIRFSTDQDKRFRVTAGGFFSEMELTEMVDFSYPGNKFVDSWGGGYNGTGFGFPENYNYPYDGQGGYKVARVPIPETQYSETISCAPMTEWASSVRSPLT